MVEADQTPAAIPAKPVQAFESWFVPPYIVPMVVVACQVPALTETGPFQPEEFWPVPPWVLDNIPVIVERVEVDVQTGLPDDRDKMYPSVEEETLAKEDEVSA